jgi:uncharacterized protein (UPF0332 family)
VTPEASRFLDKVRQCPADAVLYQPLVPRIAGREAYLAAFHAAQALIWERTGKIAKTHRGLRAQFARLTRDEPRIDQALAGPAYELKSMSDYGTGAEASISAATAEAAIATAGRFIGSIVGFSRRMEPIRDPGPVITRDYGGNSQQLK